MVLSYEGQNGAKTSENGVKTGEPKPQPSNAEPQLRLTRDAAQPDPDAVGSFSGRKAQLDRAAANPSA